MRTRITEKDSVVDYGYDRLNRLISERRTGSVNYEAAYTYDAVGNRLTKRATDGNFDYNYDNNDRLLSDGVNSYSWDNNGNMVGKNGSGNNATYSYDPENRLIEANTPSGLVRFNYDASGNRISRTNTTGTTQFLIDPNMPFAQVLEEREGVNIRSYIYGHDLLKLADPGGAEAWFSYDGLGSTRALTDTNGAIVNQYLYEGFGSILRQSGTLKNEFMFTGEQFETGLGMYYLRARYYEPGVGRFISRDPFASMLQGSAYKYCSNDPVNNVDPSGYMVLAEMAPTLLMIGLLATMTMLSMNLVTQGAFAEALGEALCMGFNSIIQSELIQTMNEATDQIAMAIAANMSMLFQGAKDALKESFNKIKNFGKKLYEMQLIIQLPTGIISARRKNIYNWKFIGFEIGGDRMIIIGFRLRHKASDKNMNLLRLDYHPIPEVAPNWAFTIHAHLGADEKNHYVIFPTIKKYIK